MNEKDFQFLPPQRREGIPLAEIRRSHPILDLVIGGAEERELKENEL